MPHVHDPITKILIPAIPRLVSEYKETCDPREPLEEEDYIHGIIPGLFKLREEIIQKHMQAKQILLPVAARHFHAALTDALSHHRVSSAIRNTLRYHLISYTHRSAQERRQRERQQQPA